MSAAARRPAARSTSVRSSPPPGRIRRQPPLDEAEIADDGGEQVVEVVRDAAGEVADRLHALRLDQLLLRPPLVGDVLRHADQVARAGRLTRGRSGPGARSSARPPGVPVAPQLELLPPDPRSSIAAPICAATAARSGGKTRASRGSSGGGPSAGKSRIQVSRPGLRLALDVARLDACDSRELARGGPAAAGAPARAGSRRPTGRRWRRRSAPRGSKERSGFKLEFRAAGDPRGRALDRSLRGQVYRDETAQVHEPT